MDKRKGFGFFTHQQDITITATLNGFFLCSSQELPLHRYILNNDETSALTHIAQYGNNKPPYLGNYNKNAHRISLSSLFGFITINGDNNHRYYRSEDKNDIFLQNEVAESALHLAIRQGMYNVVVALLEHGMPVNLIDGYGDAPLHIAAKMGNEALILLLITWGAFTALQDRRTKALALELLNRDKIYSNETIELLSHPDPIETDPKNYGTTPLHDAISQDDSENEIKELCQIVGNLIPNKDGERPSVLAKKLNRNPKIVSFLELLEVCTSFKIKYNARMLLIKHKEKNENDHDFLMISISLIKTLHFQFTIWINLNIERCEASSSASSSLAKPIEANEAELTYALDFFNYNKDTVNSILELLATCIHNISFALRGRTCDIFPWKNIRALRYLAFRYKENDATATLILDRISKYFIIDIPKVIAVLEGQILNSQEQWKTLPPKEDKKDMRIADFDSIYTLTEPIIAERTLYKISNCCLQAQSFSETSLQGRYAIMRAIKLLCEMTLYTHTSRNLSGLIKSFFPSVPWKELRQLRIYLAKNVIIPKSYARYTTLLEEKDSRHFTLAKNIFSLLSEMTQKAIIAHSELLQTIKPGKYNFEHFEPLYSLTENDKDSLLKAIDDVYQGKNEKSRKSAYKMLKPLKQSIEQNKLSIKVMKDIVNFFQGKKDKQDFWRKHFDALKKDRGGFKDFLEIFGLGSNEYEERISRPFAQKEYVNIGLRIIEQLENFLIDSPTIILELNQVKNISGLSKESQVHMLNCLELFKKDVELRFCCEQLITDLCTALSETSIKYNKEFRNYLEHIDDIFETGKRDIEQGNFFEMLDYIIDVKRRLILQFEIDSSPQLKQESGPSSVATTNSVAAENTPLFNKELEGTFSGMFSRENSSLKEQKKQQLKSRYNLPDLSEPQLARGLRNAAVNGKLDDLKDFIELGANIDANDNSQKKTALHYALEKEHMLCVHWLIEHGANYNIADALNTTAYAYARKHSLDIFRYNLQM